MSRKIIIITKDTDPNYRDLNIPLGKLIINSQEKILMKNSYLAAFQELSKYDKFSDISEKYEIRINRKWLKGTEEKKKLTIPNDIINLLDKVKIDMQGDKRLYDVINLDNGNIVYLLYWNLLGANEFNVWQCVPLICKDCKIDINATIKEIQDRHILYIHDDEWGIEGNRLLMKNSEPEKKEKEDILKALKDYFQYIATFQHSNIVGFHFNNILNCRFGEDSIADKLGELEDKETITDYIQLKQEMTKELQNGRDYL